MAVRLCRAAICSVFKRTIALSVFGRQFGRSSKRSWANNNIVYRPSLHLHRMPVCLSFDIEEHHRIESAAGLSVGAELQMQYHRRMEDSTRWLLDELDLHKAKATFFIVGQIASENPTLVRNIHDRGHEIASHGWDHRRVLAMSPREFQTDIAQSKNALEQAIGDMVVGYRAPTFSIVPQTAWAIDVLCEAGMKYDSSIYPIRHDRYGVPQAPRGPFVVRGERNSILEIPPVTYEVAGARVPMGGGGYFRLFPLFLTERALRQTESECTPPVAMLYFHPWEFDPDQPRLPLSRLSRFRTYVGLKRTRGRLGRLMSAPARKFERACDIAESLNAVSEKLPEFDLTAANDRLPEKRASFSTAACLTDKD